MQKATWQRTARLDIETHQLIGEDGIPRECQGDGIVKKVYTYDDHEEIKSPDIYDRDGEIYISTEFYDKIMQKYNRIRKINEEEARKILLFIIEYKLA